MDDPNLTPRPLRIVKRANWEDGESITAPILPTSSSRSSQVPLRRSSLSHASIQQHHTQQQDNSDVTPKATKGTSLNTLSQPGHRHTNGSPTVSSDSLESVIIATDSIPNRHEPSSLAPVSQVIEVIDWAAEHSVNRSMANVASKCPFQKRRAFTTGTSKVPDRIFAAESEPVPLAAISTTTNRPRAISTGKIDDARVPVSEACQSHELRRKPHSKNNFINRIMTGLTHRAHSSQLGRPSNIQGVTRLEKSHPAVRSRESDVDKTARRPSDSSNETHWSGDSVQDSLTAFPTPPSSNASPTSSTTRHTRAPRVRNLGKPKDNSILGAELVITPEVGHLCPEQGDSLLVAVDIKGRIDDAHSSLDSWSLHTGLDVVVIIDNSIHTSPALLMASCETTRSLASILNVVTDRMAILCTAPINEHRTLGSDHTRVWPLSPIKVKKLKQVLDAVTGSQEHAKPSSWTAVIKVATEMLLQSPVLDLDAETAQDTFGVVIVLTGHAENLPPNLLMHENLQFHVVCPTSTPNANFDAINCNGWKLRAPFSKEPEVMRSSKRLDPFGFTQRLYDLVDHARGGRKAGRLNYLSLDIKAASQCTIEKVMGKSEHLTLQPGEQHTVLVRVKVHGSATQDHSLKRAITLPGMDSGSTDLIDKIDDMLKLYPKPVRILTARLRYKHSLLPPSTFCDITADYSLPRTSSCQANEMHPAKHLATQLPPCTALVHERLAYYFAANEIPRHALSTFRKRFAEEGWCSFCPDYTRLITDELKYQARIAERLAIDASPKKAFVPVMKGMSPTQDKFLERENRRSSETNRSTNKTQGWLTNFHTDYDHQAGKRPRPIVKMPSENMLGGPRLRSKRSETRHHGRFVSLG